MKEEFNFESIKPKTIEQQKAGKPLFDKDCAFTTLLGNMLNVALKGEMDVHILQKKTVRRVIVVTVRCRNWSILHLGK